ncbi:MAG: proprotein convertase P-domain-containing protein [Lewinella sp.]|nr:proprotein convertase P-domain-containing protein [Lewinella sp.]
MRRLRPLLILLALALAAPLAGQTFSSNPGLQVGPDASCLDVGDNADGQGDLTPTITPAGLPASLGVGTVVLESVCVNISHTWVGDLQASLVSPNGVRVQLFADPGTSTSTIGLSGDDMEVCLSAAGSVAIQKGVVTDCNGPNPPCLVGDFLPIGDYADFNDGSNPNGVWTLELCDDFNGDGGVLNSWSLTFCTGDCDPGPDPEPGDGESCASAISIACGQTLSGSTAGLPDPSDAEAPNCSGLDGSGGAMWYVLAGDGSFVTAATCGSGYDTRLLVYDGSCGALSCVTGNDDACGLQSEVTFGTTPGTDYYILVEGFGTAAGNFDLSISCVAPPANDAACNAIPLSLGVPESVNNQGATAQPGEVNPGAGTGDSSCNSTDGWCNINPEPTVDNSLWYTFTPPPGEACYEIIADGGDLQLAVYTADNCGNFGTYTEVAANDDSGDDYEPGLNTFAPGLTQLALLPGVTYYIQVDGYQEAEVTNGYVLIREADCPPPPACQAPEPTATLILTTDDFAGETSWQLTDMNGLIIQEGTQEDYEDFTTYEIPLYLCGTCDNEFTIFDSFGDGICCTFGSGSWEIQDIDGNYITGTPTLGDFTGSEQSDILPQIFDLPCDWNAYSANIACSGSTAYDEGTETFTVTSEDCEHQPYSPVNEEYAYANTYLCGDGEIIAYVEDLDGLGKAWAGIVMRESASPDSKKFQVMTGRDYLQHRVDWRTSTGGTNQSQAFSRYGQHWLRIVRTGPIFQAYTSFDGGFWGQPVATQIIDMAECIEMGLIVTNVPYATNVTATFGNVWTSNDLMRPEAPTDTGGTVSDQLEAYPNPTSGLVTLNLRGYLEQGATLEVVNTFGQLLEQRRLGVIEASTEELDMSQYPAGVYLLRLRLDDGKTEHVQVVRQ